MARLRADERALLDVHLQEHVVQRLQERLVLQQLWRDCLRQAGEAKRRLRLVSQLERHALQRRRTAASRKAAHSSLGKMCLRNSETGVSGDVTRRWAASPTLNSTSRVSSCCTSMRSGKPFVTFCEGVSRVPY